MEGRLSEQRRDRLSPRLPRELKAAPPNPLASKRRRGNTNRRKGSDVNRASNYRENLKTFQPSTHVRSFKLSNEGLSSLHVQDRGSARSHARSLTQLWERSGFQRDWVGWIGLNRSRLGSRHVTDHCLRLLRDWYLAKQESVANCCIASLSPTQQDNLS